MYHLTTIPLAGCVNPPQQLTDTADDRLPAGRRSAGTTGVAIRYYSALCMQGVRDFGRWWARPGVEVALFTGSPIWIVRFVFHRI